MFTGIITDVGTITKAEQRGDLRLIIQCGYDMAGVDLGASIACSGVCLTVVDKGTDWFAIDASAETVSKTSSAMWAQGRRLNLERALKIGDELGGHIVTGHVDGVGTIAAIAPEGDSHRVSVTVGAEIAPYIATKGSVTVDGVSLTVNSVADNADGTATFGLIGLVITAYRIRSAIWSSTFLVSRSSGLVWLWFCCSRVLKSP